MTERIIALEQHRGGPSLPHTEITSQLLAAEKTQRAIKAKLEFLETQLAGTPSVTLTDAIERARYLIGLLAHTTAGRDPRRKKLITTTLDDLERLMTPATAQNA